MANPCQGFIDRVLGAGLSLRLPPTLEPISYEGTTESGTVHEGATYQFVLGQTTFVVGRFLTSPTASDTNSSTREDSGAVLFVRSNESGLRECLLASMRYDPSIDRTDPG